MASRLTFGVATVWDKDKRRGSRLGLWRWCRDLVCSVWAEKVSRPHFEVATWFGLLGVTTYLKSRHGLACSRSRPGFGVATWTGKGLGQLGRDLGLQLWVCLVSRPRLWVATEVGCLGGSRPACTG